jgi:hypothetical protein
MIGGIMAPFLRRVGFGGGFIILLNLNFSLKIDKIWLIFTKFIFNIVI